MVNVLVVDYGMPAARRLGDAIDGPGLNRREAGSSAEAVREAVADPPDLVIVDLTAGSREAFNLAVVLKMHKRSKPPKVAGVSAIEGEVLSRLEPGLRYLGIDRCVSRAWPLERQVEAIRKMLGRTALLQEGFALHKD